MALKVAVQGGKPEIIEKVVKSVVKFIPEVKYTGRPVAEQAKALIDMFAPVPRGGGPRAVREAAVPVSEIRKGPWGWFGPETKRNAQQRVRHLDEAERARGLPAMTADQRVQREYYAAQSEVISSLQDYITQVTGFKRTAPELGALRATGKRKGVKPSAASKLQAMFDPRREHMKADTWQLFSTKEQHKSVTKELDNIITMMLLFIGSAGAAGAILEPREAM